MKKKITRSGDVTLGPLPHVLKKKDIQILKYKSGVKGWVSFSERSTDYIDTLRLLLCLKLTAWLLWTLVMAKRNFRVSDRLELGWS